MIGRTGGKTVKKMNRFEEESKNIVRVLGLRFGPIAGKFSSNPEELGDSSRKLSVCEAFRSVRRDRLVIKLSRKNCTCPGGRHFMGMDVLPVKVISAAVTKREHKIYESMDVAVASVSRQPRPVNRGDFFVLGPLEKFKDNPDVVFLFATPAQADRILGLVSYKGAEPFMYYPASSICSTITNVLAKGKPEINLIAAFERRQGKWSQDELIVALPLKDFEAAVENIPHSGFGKTENPEQTGGLQV